MLNNKFEMVDFHSHILPCVDDGSDSLETSIKMLELSHSQGVDIMLSTSHYYNFADTVDSFVVKRDRALYSLEKHIKEHDLDLPDIVPAAEVRLYPEMRLEKNLDALCIDGTKNILVEMPYSSWSGWMYNEIYAIITRGYTPVMAHLERYLGMVSEKEIMTKLLPMGVYVQCNADSFLDRKMKGFIKRLIRYGKLTVIGSDFHNLTERISHFDEAASYLQKKYGEEFLQVLMENALYLAKPNS